MRFYEPLDDLLQTKSYVRVLRALEGLPNGIEASTREIARRAGVSHPTSSTVLENLRKQGLVTVRRTLWADEFALNERHILTKQLRHLFQVERQVLYETLTYLAKEVRARADWIGAAYVFGSAARGDMKANSDLDIALTCPPRRATQAQALLDSLSERTAERFGNRIHGIIGTKPIADMAKAGQPGYRLWRAVAKDGLQFLPSIDRRVRSSA